MGLKKKMKKERGEKMKKPSVAVDSELGNQSLDDFMENWDDDDESDVEATPEQTQKIKKKKPEAGDKKNKEEEVVYQITTVLNKGLSGIIIIGSIHIFSTALCIFYLTLYSRYP